MNLKATRQYYSERGMLTDFCKEYVCKHCEYRYACAGIKDEARIDCKDFKQSEYEKEPEQWVEMSDHRFFVSRPMGYRFSHEYQRED